jgi:hypothetical protein
MNGYDGTPDISYSYGWETDMSAAWGMVARVAPNRLQQVMDVVRSGRYSVRAEVRPGDLVLSGMRAEVLTMIGENNESIFENESSGTQYYALSVRLHEKWTPPTMGIFLQLHGPSHQPWPPVFSLQALDHFAVMLHSGNLDDINHLDRMKYPLSKWQLNIGHWVDFVVKIKFAKDFTGGVDVWRRDEGETSFVSVLSLADIPTLQYILPDGVQNHYWQHGLYHYPRTFPNALWLDCLTRGTGFDAVVTKAFG